MKKGSSSYDVIPKFFKVYLPRDSGDDLELPMSFNSYLPIYLPKTVTLRGSHGNTWEMALRKCGGEKYVMVNGWKMILDNEDLKGGDFLAFEFDGSRCFNFCIYEPYTMCKKLRRNSVQSNEIKVESDGEDQTKATDDFVGLDDDEEDNSDDSDYNYGDDAAVEDDHDDDDNYTDASAIKDDDDVVVVAADGAAVVDDNDDVEVVDADDAAVKDDDDVEVVDADEATVVDDDEVEAVDADDDVETDDERKYLDDHENPSFTLTLNPNKRSQLLIPARVIKDYDLHFPESITLVDPLVKKFGPLEKKMKIQTNGSVFVKGFGSVIRRNKVKTTDKMIFEIKKIGNNNLVHTIKIHIVSG